MCPKAVTWDIPESSDDAVVLVVDDAGSPALDAAAIPHLTLPGPHALGGVNLGKGETVNIPAAHSPPVRHNELLQSELHHHHCGSATRTSEKLIILESQNTELFGIPTLIKQQSQITCVLPFRSHLPNSPF